MRNVTCEKCGKGFPLNDTLKVRDSVICGACAKSIFTKEKIPANQVQRQVDPTVCIGCGLDNGDADLGKLGQLPVCPECEAFFKNRPFPGWIKAALVGMVILVVSTLAWNSRFFRAYYDLTRFESAMIAGDIQRGTAYILSASRHIPENMELQTYGALYKGLLLLNQDKSAEALKLLQSCRGRVGDESYLDDLIMSARIGVAFEQGEYGEFLRLALEMNEKHKDNPIYVGQLASAYACKYAETEDDQYKAMSLAALDYSRTLSGTKPEDKEYCAEYEQRILHRLYTREIISRNEFNKRYPDGWTKEEGAIQ